MTEQVWLLWMDCLKKRLFSLKSKLHLKKNNKKKHKTPGTMSSVYQSILESGVRPSVVWLSYNTAIISKVQQQIYNRGATEEQITSTLVIQHNIIQVNSWHSWVAQSNCRHAVIDRRVNIQAKYLMRLLLSVQNIQNNRSDSQRGQEV